jgi:septum formation protein
MDKAGAYGIQGLGAALVPRIDGDYYAVMGLGLVTMLRLVEEVGGRYEMGRGILITGG